jgi:hypothetical protein
VLQAGLAVLVFAAAGWYVHRLRHPEPERSDPVSSALQRLKASELSPQERAMMAQLRNQRRVAMADPLPEHRVRRGQGAVEVPPVAHQQARQLTLGHAAPVGPVAIQQLFPADGAIVGGQTTIRVVVAGAASRIVCEVDGTRIGATSAAAPYFRWNTRASGNGPHQVTVTATGAGGAASASVTLNVMNR